MIRALTLRARAESELEDAVAWYEAAVPGLGVAFLEAVAAGLARIQANPESYPFVGSRIRRAPVRRFPYEIFYVVRRDRIDVIAVFHAKRRPRRFA